ncbi:MAG: hypothetical protein CVU00_15245, partial [Bacteroidetes bacterium HGW-Bacteroidetes-17]
PPTSVSSNSVSVCINAGGNITLTAVGGSGTTLRWFTGSCGGTDIGTGNPLTIPSPIVTTTYYARWENNCGNSTCANTTVTVIQLPVAPSSAESDRDGFCADDAGNIALTARGGSGATLKWFTESCGGTEIGAINPLTIASPTATTTYYARWENSCGVSACAQVTVSVLPLAVAPTSASVDRDGICYNDNGNIILSATGGSGDELQWFTGSCGGTPIGTGNNLTIASPAITTTYYVRWSNTCGPSSCVSFTVTINVVTPGAIAADQTICYGGDPATITSTTAGTGLGNISYRWESSISPFSTWNPIAGATGPTYDPPTGLTETTQYRRITVSDYNGGCESDPTTAITVTVQSAPTAGSIAADQYICFGGIPDPLTSIENGTGDGTITYRWERSVAPFTVWTTIAGITTSGYNPGPLAFTTQFRRFTVSTLNGVTCESVASNIITITIQDVAVTAGSIGNNQTICYGDTPANLVSVIDGTATSGATVSYNWQINNTGTWVDIAGEIGAGLNISTPHTITTSYRRRTVATLAGNSCVSNWTVAVTITVIQTVTPGSIAASQTICNGSTPAPLTSVTNGSSPGAVITYSWEQSTDAGGTWTPIGGATLATYAPGALTQTTWYRRITVATTNSHSCYSVPTNTVIITVQDVVLPGTIAADQTICYGATPTPLTSVTPGSGTTGAVITYQWENSINNGANWNSIAGATGLGYAPGALIQTTWYRRFTYATLNGVICHSVDPSNIVIITVQGAIVSPVASANQTICYNTTPALLSRTNASGGSGNFTYQWQNSIDNINFTDIAGQTAPTYQPPALIATTYYRVSVTDADCGGPFYSNVVTITLRPELVAPEICCDQIICTGYSAEPITIILPPSGGSGSYSYQWEVSTDNVNWNIIPGAILPIYKPSTQDRYYRLRVTDNTCATIIYSNTVHVYTAFSISANFNVEVNPSGQLCPGSTVTVSVVSGNLTVTNKYIRYSWTADPNFIDPDTGGPVGNTDCFLWIFCWHWADIPYTVRNTTNATVTTNLLITPIVYYENGTVNCILPTETVPVTIRPFMLQCPSDITANNATGSCSAQVAIPNIQWVTNSCISTVNWTMSGATTASGTGNMGTRTFNVGVTNVTYSSDLNGQNTSCSFTVTVFDTQAPTLTCPTNITQNTDAGQCTASITVPNPTISDNCGGVGGISLLTWEMTGATTGNSPTTGVNYVGSRTFNAGVTTITYYAEDAAGNSSTCSFTVTVTDTQSPVISNCPANISVGTDVGLCTATLDPPDPSITDNCYDLLAVTWAMTGTTTGTSPATGINFVGNTTFNPGVTTITYTARDPGSNMASCIFTVTVTDNQPPTFVFCPPGYNQGVNPGECFATIATTDPEPFDNCGISSLTWSISGATTVSGSGNIGNQNFNVGTSTVVYTLTDNSVPPQTATCTFDVNVTDNIPPTITCPGNQTRSTDPDVCTYTTQGTEFNPVVTDNCTSYTLSNNLTGGPTLAGFVFPIGTTTVQWVVIDAGGNSRLCSLDITIEDNQLPVISECAPPQTADADENCQAAVPDVTGMVVVTDNCTQTGDFTITQVPAAGTLVGVGGTTITITAEDEEGNTVTCTTSLTVADNTAPVFANCPTAPINLGCNPATLPNEAMAITDAGTVTDNCIANPTVSAVGGSVTNTGCDYTQTWTVTASDGTNTAQCEVVFEWIISPAMTINCSVAVNLAACTPQANIQSAYNTWVSGFSYTGGCGVTTNIGSIPSLPANADCDGVNLSFTYTVTDICGENETCSSTFVVAPSPDVIVTCSPPVTLPACTALADLQTEYNSWLTGFSFTGGCDATSNIGSIPALPANANCDGVNLSFTYTVTDICGQTEECTTTFTVEADTENPTASNPSPIVLNGCNGTFPPPDITVVTDEADNCGMPTVTWIEDGTPSLIDCTETTIRTYRVMDDCGNYIDVQQTLQRRVDEIDPVITCPGDQTVVVNTGSTYVHAGSSWDATASDNCPGTIALTAMLTGDTESGPHTTLDGVTFNQGLTTVTWTATDECGNTATCVFDVQMEGTADIEVVKTGPSTITAGEDITWTVTVTNNGPAVAPLVMLIDIIPLPAIIAPATYTINGTPSGNWTGSLPFTNMTIGVGGVQVIEITGKVSCDANDFSNEAMVAVSLPFIDPNPGN